MILLKNVSKTYDGGETFAVRRTNLHIRKGEFLVLLGESGCGKTTTLKMINRLVDPSDGVIEVGGQDSGTIPPVELRRRIGYVFQGIGLFPHMTVAANVAIIPKLLGWSREDIESRVEELLELVNLEPGEYGDRKPDDLSGGQRQRVGLARALAGKSGIMLMDEPFGALDPLTRDALQGEYRKIHDELNLTTVMVTHDMVEALLMADRIVAMHAGDVLQVGTPQELMRAPVDNYVRSLMETPKRQADRLEALSAEQKNGR